MSQTVADNFMQDCRILNKKRSMMRRKAALTAQFAAEATLRRVHAAQKDEDMPPIEAILAPLEAELKLARQEVLDLSIVYLVSSFFHHFLSSCCLRRYFRWH
jgi:hypothetical protein